MRNISLFILLFVFSCSHFNSLRKPSSLTLSLEKQRSLLWNSAYRMIMDERPDLYDQLQSYKIEAQKFYLFLGKVESGKVKGLASPLKKRGNPFTKVIDVSNLKQIPFSRWQEMESERLDAYFKGEYVFMYDNKIFTLWGSEVSKKNIVPYMWNAKKDYLPGANDNDVLMAIMHHKELFRPLVSDDQYYLLPSFNRFNSYMVKRVMDDFSLQVHLGEIDFSHIAEKGYLPLVIGDYTEYFSLKNFLMRRGDLVKDSNKACDTKVYVSSFSVKKTARVFVDTLIEHKENLMKELSMTNNQYNEMMAIAVGILAVESKLGASFKYHLKEDIRVGKLNLGQEFIKLVKRIKGRDDENSRGLTQIKNIAPLLEDTSYAYLENADLDDPKHAAIATMFVLKEKYGYLMHFKKSHRHIDDFNWQDYLYYFYQGASREVTRGTGTPWKNLRIRKILQLRNHMKIFEKCE